MSVGQCCPHRRSRRYRHRRGAVHASSATYAHDVRGRGYMSDRPVVMGDTVISSLLERARAGQAVAKAETTALRTQLPFRYLRQQSHLTAPANDFSLAEKAITSAPRVAARLLERYGITESG